jgi:hypothetical protein
MISWAQALKLKLKSLLPELDSRLDRLKLKFQLRH